jgi:hypothetical protein
VRGEVEVELVAAEHLGAAVAHLEIERRKGDQVLDLLDARVRQQPIDCAWRGMSSTQREKEKKKEKRWATRDAPLTQGPSNSLPSLTLSIARMSIPPYTFACVSCVCV